MSHIYNITDSSDGSLLLTIETETKCATKLASIKKNADRIWYRNEDREPLSPSDKEVVDNTVNGDWVEIFSNIATLMGVEYTKANVEVI